MKKQFKMKLNQFEGVHVDAKEVKMGEIPAIQIVKKDKVMIPDENTFLKLKDLDFHNGHIEVKILSRLLKDAPEISRGFLGIVFRVNEENNEFESFYVRPTNSKNCTDPIRKKHACQYFSYPGYTFSYFREYGIEKYENSYDHMELNEWITIEADIEDEKALFSINKEPVLEVTDLKHGKDARGSVGIYIDLGTEGYVSKINVECAD